MKDVTASASGADTQTVNPNTNRIEQLQRLLAQNYRDVEDAALVPGLFAEDADRVINATVRNLQHYTGPIEAQPFIEWVATAVRASAERIVRFLQIRSENRKVVRKAIISVISTCVDLGARPAGTDRRKPAKQRDEWLGSLGTVDEIEQDTWEKVFLDMDRWFAPGYSNDPKRKPAKLSTRLYAFARLQAMGWRTTRLREQQKLSDVEVKRIGTDEKGERFIEPANYETEMDKPWKAAAFER